jgi:hypothetical protein
VTAYSMSSDSPKSALSHVVITRFSFRNVSSAANSRGISPWLLTEDPLSPRRLDFRLAVFEITCAASLLGQSNQDFEWILIVDRMLPEHYRARLIRLLCGRPRTHLHVYDHSEDLGSADWLRRYIPAGCSRILTTQLDDDDALPSNFMEVLRKCIDQQDTAIPAIRVAASRRVIQWELVSSARAPLGYRCAWHRGNWIVSTGLSLLSPAGSHALTVLSLDHRIADIWMCNARGEALRSMLIARWGSSTLRTADVTRFVAGQLNQFQERVRRMPGTSIPRDDNGFLDLTAEVGAVVVTNHFLNDQCLRLLEPKADRLRAVGPECFPNVPLRLDRFRECAPVFRKTWSHYARLVRIVVPRMRGWRERARLLVWASRRFINV